VTIAVWVGYDNGDGKRRSLGSTETGARLALPIFEPIINAVWSANIAPKALLNGPSPEAQAHLIHLPIDFASGQRVTRGSFVEHFRLDANGELTSPNDALKRKLATNPSSKVPTHPSVESRTAERNPSLHQVYDYWSTTQSFSGIWGWR
jgi:membrane carboxypeptidase/penicillin-binding protein